MSALRQWIFIQIKPGGFVNLDHVVSVELDLSVDEGSNAVVKLTDGRVIHTGTGVQDLIDKIGRAVNGG